ncbi:MAG: DUF454 family protein [Gammaproteobacteria bacterium]|jgi:uncharacterized membrane protein YbaN (DUF454 family)
MNVNSMKRHAGHLSVKLLFALVVIACLALGIIGLLLPIIPGLLFLGITGVLLAPHVPALNDWMRRSPLMSRYMDDAENLRSLEFPDQIRLGFFLSLRMLLDGAKFVFGVIAGLFDNRRISRGRSKRTRSDSHDGAW